MLAGVAATAHTNDQHIHLLDAENEYADHLYVLENDPKP